MAAEPTPSTSEPLSMVISRDAVAAYFAQSDAPGESRETPWSALKLAAFVADQANQAGLLSRLDKGSREWIDVVAALSVVFDHPHAVVLLDVNARPCSDDGHELAGLQAALVIRTGGHNERITERIQHLLGVYTNTEYASLAEQSADGVTRFSLRDSRLEPWAQMSWGSFGDYYIITIGEGAFERIVATMRDPRDSLSQDPWYAAAVRYFATPPKSKRQNVKTQRRTVTVRERRKDGNAVTATRGKQSGRPTEPSYACYVRFDRLRRSSDAAFDAKVQWVQYALGLAGVQRGLWLAGQSTATGSVEVIGVHHQRDGDTVHRLAGESVASGLPDGAVPELASGFAVIDSTPSDVFYGATNAYLAARGLGVKERFELGLGRIEKASGVSVDRDVLTALGGPVVIHNYPRHALRLPLAWTLLVPIRGNPHVLRDRVDRILRAVQKQWTGENSSREGGGVRLVRTVDGIWYLQYGLAGPALTITDRWLVLSFSPHAVRQNVALLTGQADRP